ncbi:glycosyltransferase [Poritiphilus flavus]|uniref:Glycosyltransferase n=1 Tax=Poritiphilus flavus TaxID=2697053 RepID=A0A6L9EJ05_9FLAO|nr:glycosyltransferase family A protein [Poritiphilus flavus]NAS14159.1 glycosyltransferase [Poritiphilus flavus]
MSDKSSTTIIIPTHNEEENLSLCLNSFVSQTQQPTELIIVDDNSTDGTFEIAKGFSEKHHWIHLVQNHSSELHIPGKKVVDAFNKGLSHSKNKFRFIGKFDADIVLPGDYFEKILNHFHSDNQLGLCSGLLFIERNGKWVYEAISNKSHVRGPIKMYSAECFKKIGGLRASIGWDTLDELLVQYHGYSVLTDHSLTVKHLRPTGGSYSSNTARLQGTALYKMRYGLLLCLIASLKMAWQRKKPAVFIYNLQGYWRAQKDKIPFIVSEEEGNFIRKYRWTKIRAKLF